MWHIVEYMDGYKPQEIVEGKVKMYSEGGDITYRSVGYKTREELLEGEKVLENPCVLCGGIVSTNYISPESMIEKNMCFSCDFWDNRILHKDEPNVFIINGEWYTDSGCKPRNYKGFLGFAGHEFVIETNDGRTISTNNLWYGGKIPKHFIDKLPDNAKFVKQ